MRKPDTSGGGLDYLKKNLIWAEKEEIWIKKGAVINCEREH